MTTTRLRFASLLTVALLPALSGCKAEEPPPPEAPRPITVVELKVIDPIGPLQISGSVRSWNEQSVSFEVAGPVAFIVKESTNVQGRWVDQNAVVTEGDLLARLNDRDFLISRAAAAAELEVAKADVALAKVELAELLPAQLRAAVANQTRADAEYRRFVKAFETNAVSELDVIKHKADLDQRTAETDQAKAEIESKRVEIQSLESKVARAQQALAEAEYDIERCTLPAPFTGEVAEIFVEAGGYASVAKPVAHLVMMDPIRVDVSVSAERAAQLRIGDQVKLYPLGGGESYGNVYDKSTSADAKTRTFRVSVLARNSRVIVGLPEDSPLRELPRVEEFARVQRLDHARSTSPFVVEERKALRKDAEGYFVWAADEIPRGTSLDPKNPVLTFRKVRVVPSDVRANFQGLYVARGLSDPGELTGDWVVAHNAPADFAGGKTLIALRDWQLRPGQIVPTLLGGRAPKPGLYIPMRALVTSGESKSIFIEQDGVARRVQVKPVEAVAELLRVEPVAGDGSELLTAGARVVMDLVHSLRDGERVRVVRTRELTK